MNGKEYSERDNLAQKYCNSNEWRATSHLVFLQLFTSIRDFKDCCINRRYFYN